MISLGCAKNQVDAEIMLAALQKAGYEIKDDVALADVAIVNTCGFIEAAKKESIDEILELAKLKKEGRIKAIVVTGCLAERYKEEIMKELPEADAVAGIGANGRIAEIVEEALQQKKPQVFPAKRLLPMEGDRILGTPSYFAYLKIAEGCSNGCAYCAIPMIRGGYRSRSMESIVAEAEKLVADGAKELILIAQDTSRYGWDLYGRLALPELLKKLCAIQGLRWIRMLYCYPDSITDELLEVMASEEKIVKYMDLPLQHCSGRVLRAMKRKGDREELTALIQKIREKVPGVILRTTMITGFPGETEEDFQDTLDIVRQVRYDSAFTFIYSKRTGTPAAAMEDQVPDDVVKDRFERLLKEVQQISAEVCSVHQGTTQDVLVESVNDHDPSLVTGRMSNNLLVHFPGDEFA